MPWTSIVSCSVTITGAAPNLAGVNVMDFGPGNCGKGKLKAHRALTSAGVEGIDYTTVDNGQSGLKIMRNYYMRIQTSWEATTYAYQGSITINYEPPPANSFSGDFDILPDSTLTYGDTFNLHPKDIATTGSCTFQSVKFRIERDGLVYTGNAIASKTTDDVYTLAKYPAVMLAGATHDVYMQINTSCGSDWVGPKELYLMDPNLGGGGPTPTPTPAPGENHPPTATIAWVKPGTTTPVGFVPVGSKVDLVITGMNDPDYPDDWVDVDHWDFTASTDWLKTVPDGFGGNISQNSYNNITASEIGSHKVALTVKDLKGATYTAYATMNVVDSKPVAVIRGPSSVKEGRPLPTPFDGKLSYSPIGLKIVDEVWTNVQTTYMTPGTETITLKVKDEEDRWSDVTSKLLNVIPDEPPIDTLAVPEQGTRLGSVTIQSGAYSPDYDNIVSHKIEMKYDAANDGFGNDGWQTVVNGNGDADSYTFTPNRVGKYLFQETVCEDFGRCGNTDSQPEAQRTLNVTNLAPTASVITDSSLSDPPESSSMLMTDLYNNGRFYNINNGVIGDKSNWKIDTGGILTSKSRTSLTNNTRADYGTWNNSLTSASFGVDGVPRMSPFTGLQAAPMQLTQMSFVDNPVIPVLDDDKYTYVGSIGWIRAYNKSMQLVWERNAFPGYIWQMMTYGNVLVVVGESSLGGGYHNIVAFDRNTGQQIFNANNGGVYASAGETTQIPTGILYRTARYDFSGTYLQNVPFGVIDGISQKYGVMVGSDSSHHDTSIARTSDMAVIGTKTNVSSSSSYLGADDQRNLYFLTDLPNQWGTTAIAKFNLGSSSYSYSPNLTNNYRTIGMDNRQRVYMSGADGTLNTTYFRVVDSSGNLITTLSPFTYYTTSGGTYKESEAQMIVGADGTINLFGVYMDTTGYLDNLATIAYASYDTNLNLITSGTVGQIKVGVNRFVRIYPHDDQSFVIVSRGGGDYDPYFQYILRSNGSAAKSKIIDVGEATPDLITGQFVAADKTLKASLKASTPDGKGAGIAFRLRDDRNYYSVEWEANELRVKKTVNGSAAVVWSKWYPMVANQVYDVKIVPGNNSFDVYINRVYQATINESSWKDGNFGIINRGQQNVSFLAASIETTPAGYGKIEGIALVGQQVNYTLSYSDEESDPQLTAGSTWVYSHNPYTLLQPQGTASFNGQTLSSPVTSFPYAGDYTFTYKTKDDPHPEHRYPDGSFNSYRQDSNTVTGKIRVHRRPIADFTATWNSNGTISYTDASYDPDRYNPADGSYSTENTGINYQATRGVLEYRYRYRTAGSTTYIEQKPAKLFGGTYIIELSVRDEYNAWSEWSTQTIVAGGSTPLPPNPGFTITPTTQYRFTTVTINSTASDPQDGARENIEHAYYIKNLTAGGPESLQSDARTSWTKEFSTLGIFQIRQVVINSYGLYAETSGNVSIVNRKPVVNITEPASTSAAAPTMYDTQRPTIKWTYSDGDGDPETQYQLHFYKSDGSFYRDSGAIGGSDLAWTPTANFADNTTYYVYVRAFDGMDWSDWATPHYFRIVTNKPPTGDFNWSPKPVYEGDTVQFSSAVDDPDKDTLDVTYEITPPSGTKQTFNYTWSNPYPTTGPSVKMVLVGNWTVKMTVSDRKAPAVTITKVVTVLPLSVTGQVSHTSEWDLKRLAYNQEHADAPRATDVFWAGEKFILSSDTTDTGTATKAVSVKVTMKTYSSNLTASNPSAIRWTGSMWQNDFDTLPDGTYSFTFTATWSNGTVKTSVVPIRIKDDIYDEVKTHRVH